MSDKRSVATDALETLGEIIDDTAKRDAIHLAVIPVQAGEGLLPGCDVWVDESGRGGWVTKPHQPGVGIADPFLFEPINPGQWFWLVLYPRTINSLRHVWTHPAFPDEDVPAGIFAARKKDSEAWLRRFCERNYADYDYVIGKAGSNNSDYSINLGTSDSGDLPLEFWDHIETILGRKVPFRPTYFSCSC